MQDEWKIWCLYSGFLVFTIMIMIIIHVLKDFYGRACLSGVHLSIIRPPTQHGLTTWQVEWIRKKLTRCVPLGKIYSFYYKGCDINQILHVYMYLLWSYGKMAVIWTDYKRDPNTLKLSVVGGLYSRLVLLLGWSL